MSEMLLSDVHRDVLQEITNIGMGRAGAALASLLGTFVTLSIPSVQLVPPAALPALLAGCAPGVLASPVIRQAFKAGVNGEAVVMFGPNGIAGLRGMMGYDDELAAHEHEVLTEVANLLVGACVQRVFEQLGQQITFSAPTVEEAIRLDASAQRWSVALLLHVHFSLEQSGFMAHLAMLLPDSAIVRIRAEIDRIIGE
ncbi:chemotaxis protein CheC [Paraburkholderia phosphatilytica]|uniref:chemotaxis protein CheC n=1 Tax=Paraburkholderia phosphatilytica TaxID=2282883 RepID=UPI000E4FA6CF|nr:chemotaxis protein CheC [Paraburkholderia phosphatilytica]